MESIIYLRAICTLPNARILSGDNPSGLVFHDNSQDMFNHYKLNGTGQPLAL